MARVRRSRRVDDPPTQATGLSWPVRWLVASLLAGMVLLALTSLVGDSPTVDECIYPVEGQYYLHTGDFRFNPQNPPLLKLLVAIPLVLHGARLDLAPQWHTNLGGWEPWVLSTKFALDNLAHYHQLFIEARMVPLALAVLLGLFVFRWSAALWGTPGGLLSLGLYVLCPNVLAHARLATPDLPVTCFMFLSSYALWRAATRARGSDVVRLGIFVGLAFATKFSALLLGPILGTQAWLLVRDPRASGATTRWCLPWSPAKSVAIAAGIALGVIALFYGFSGLFAPWSSIPFASGAFRGVASAAPWLRLPVPDALLLGIDAKTADAGGSEFPGFMFGSWARGGFRAFYVASWLTKTPIAGLALLGWATIASLDGGTHRTRASFLLAITPVVAFLVLYAGETLAVHPYYLSFFNPLGGGPADGWKAFVDSNQDWGQDLRRLREWMEATGTRRVHLAYFGHVPPQVYGIAYTPLRRGDRPAGVIAISTSLLQGLPYPITYEEPGVVRAIGADDFAWLRTQTPIGRAGTSILLFRVGGGT